MFEAVAACGARDAEASDFDGRVGGGGREGHTGQLVVLVRGTRAADNGRDEKRHSHLGVDTNSGDGDGDKGGELHCDVWGFLGFSW